MREDSEEQLGATFRSRVSARTLPKKEISAPIFRPPCSSCVLHGNLDENPIIERHLTIKLYAHLVSSASCIMSEVYDCGLKVQAYLAGVASLLPPV